MYLDEKRKAIVNISEMQKLADEIGNFVERMNVIVEFHEDKPFIKVYNIVLSEADAIVVLQDLHKDRSIPSRFDEKVDGPEVVVNNKPAAPVVVAPAVVAPVVVDAAVVAPVVVDADIDSVCPVGMTLVKFYQRFNGRRSNFGLSREEIKEKETAEALKSVKWKAGVIMDHIQKTIENNNTIIDVVDKVDKRRKSCRTKTKLANQLQ